MNVPHINGWPLWTMTYRCGRSIVTATFFQPTEAAAIRYGIRYAADLAVATGRPVLLVSLA